MPLISSKIHLELNWIEDCISSSARNSAKFKITDATFHVPIVNLSTTDNINLTKQLSDGFNIGLLCIVEILKLFILTVLELSIFLRKLTNLLDIKT